MNKYFINHKKREQTKKKKNPHQAWKQKKKHSIGTVEMRSYSPFFFHTKQAHLTIMGHKIKDSANLPINSKAIDNYCNILRVSLMTGSIEKWGRILWIIEEGERASPSEITYSYYKPNPLIY